MYYIWHHAPYVLSCYERVYCFAIMAHNPTHTQSEHIFFFQIFKPSHVWYWLNEKRICIVKKKNRKKARKSVRL